MSLRSALATKDSQRKQHGSGLSSVIDFRPVAAELKVPAARRDSSDARRHQTSVPKMVTMPIAVCHSSPLWWFYDCCRTAREKTPRRFWPQEPIRELRGAVFSNAPEIKRDLIAGVEIDSRADHGEPGFKEEPNRYPTCGEKYHGLSDPSSEDRQQD